MRFEIKMDTFWLAPFGLPCKQNPKGCLERPPPPQPGAWGFFFSCLNQAQKGQFQQNTPILQNPPPPFNLSESSCGSHSADGLKPSNSLPSDFISHGTQRELSEHQKELAGCLSLGFGTFSGALVPKVGTQTLWLAGWLVGWLADSLTAVLRRSLLQLLTLQLAGGRCQCRLQKRRVASESPVADVQGSWPSGSHLV